VALVAVAVALQAEDLTLQQEQVEQVLPAWYTYITKEKKYA
jgi:hypothetical protein